MEIQLSELSIKANRCRQHYLAVFTDQQQFANKSQALDEALHHFLNQRPVGKDISWLDRATGLAAAPFWREADVVKASKLSSLNGTGHYRLDHIRQIWGDKHSWACRYVLADGSELIHGEVSSPGWECLLML